MAKKSNDSRLLKLPNDDGTAPPTRLDGPDDLRALYLEYAKNDRQRSIQRALVRANLSGSPPYDPKKRKGIGWQANVNWLGLKSRIRAAAQPYHALFSVEPFALIKTNFRRLDPEHQRWNDCLSANFHWLLKTWQELEWHDQHCINELLIEGWAPCVFDTNEDNWRYTAINAASVLVADGTPSCLDDRTSALLLRVPHRTRELYRHIQDETRLGGWNVAPTQMAIRAASKSIGGNQWRTAPWELWQRKMQRHELATSETESDIVHCIHAYVPEYDGGVSLYIIPEEDSSERLPGKKTERSGTEHFLYAKQNQFESYAQAACVFFNNLGDGEWHSVRGMAMDGFRHDVMLNRLLCRVADATWLESTQFLSTDTQENNDKMAGVELKGALVQLPAGLLPVNTKLSGALGSMVQVFQLFSNENAQNLGTYNQRSAAPEYAGGEKPTAFQISMQVQKEQTLAGDQLALFFLQRDRLLSEQVRRACRKNTQDNMAKEFQERCRKDGVPPEALQQIECVYANRQSGYGSPQMRQMIGKELLSIASMYPEEGKNNLLNDYTTAVTQNPNAALRYNPPQQRITADDELIVLENAAMKQLERPPLVSGQNDVNHCKGHLESADGKLAPLRDELENTGHADPEEMTEAYQYIQVVAPHVEEHISRLQADPTRAQLARLFEQQLTELSAFHGKLRQAVRSAHRQALISQQQEQQAGALGALDQQKLQSAQLDDALKVKKADRDTQLKTYKTVHSEQLKTLQTRADIIRKSSESRANGKNGNE